LSTDHWLIYALGGGWGHLTRALTLGRRAAERHRVSILTNSPYAELIPPTFLPANLNIQSLDPTLNRDQICRLVLERLGRLDYDCLIVDTFPRGLGGELVSLLESLPARILRVLVHRDLAPAYVEAKAIAPFVSQTYPVVLVPGEGDWVPLAHLPQVKHTAPWLVCNGDELPSPEHCASILRISDRRNPVVLVCAAGQSSELEMFGRLTDQLAQAFPDVTVRCLTPSQPATCPPELWLFHYPALDCLFISDVVVGSAGYNTVAECEALGVPLVAIALERIYDRQALRLRRYGHAVLGIPEVDFGCAAIATVQKLLNQQSSQVKRNRRHYRNGAMEAVTFIESHLP
jgi:hypothetical protein